MTASASSLLPSVVVDASVAVKWLLTEPDSPQALTLLSGTITLHAPDLLFPEVGNILWKRVRAGEITEAKAKELMEWLAGVPFVLHPALPLMLAAIEIACQYDRSVYNSLYLALAVREGCPLITADQKLSNSLTGTSLASTVLLVQTL